VQINIQQKITEASLSLPRVRNQSFVLPSMWCWDNWFTDVPSGNIHRYGLFAPGYLDLNEIHLNSRIFHGISRDKGASWQNCSPIKFSSVNGNQQGNFNLGKYTFWSGSAVYRNGSIYLFFTLTDKKTLEQSIWMARSRDGENFTSAKRIIKLTTSNNDVQFDKYGVIPACRDSYVYIEGNTFHMLLAQKSDYKGEKNIIPSVGYATASVQNPYEWTVHEPLVTFPDFAGTQVESPSVVNFGAYKLLAIYHSECPGNPLEPQKIGSGIIGAGPKFYSRNGQGNWVKANVSVPEKVHALHLKVLGSKLLASGFVSGNEEKLHSASDLFHIT